MRDNNAHDGSERMRDNWHDGSERTRDKAKDGSERMRDNNAHDGSERTRGDGRKSLRHQGIEPRPIAWEANILTIRPSSSPDGYLDRRWALIFDSCTVLFGFSTG